MMLINILLFSSLQTLDAQTRREVGNLILEDIPEIPEEVSSRLKQYTNSRSASFADWLPNDEGMLISTRFGNTKQLHTVNSPGGSRNQITFFDEPVSRASYCPSSDYNGFLFTKDIGGNEFTQIYWYDMETRKSEMLSDGTSVNRGISWSNKGDKFAFISTRRNKKDIDVYITDMESPKIAKIVIDQGGGVWVAAGWSADDTKLLLNQYLSRTRSNAYILDIATKELTKINNNKTESIFAAISFDKQGDKIYSVTDLNGEFNTLAQYDINTKKLKYLTEDIPWDIEKGVVNSNKTKAVFSMNENGFSQLYLMDLETNKYEKIKDLPIGQISSIKFHPSRDEVAMVMNTTSSPGDVYSLDLETKSLQRWTSSEVGGLNTALFPKPELIHYETFDEVDGVKRKIPVFVYKPQNAQGPLPVLISIHGGPEVQHVPYFSSFNAFLANELGITVIAPNVRGSSGYGKSYLKLDNGFNRENSVKDIGKLIEWIEGNEVFDKNRIAVSGGSYGGYMVLSSMYNFNDKLKCGIDIVGISNFVTFLENTKAYRRDLRRTEYGDEREPKMRDYLLSISPTNHAEKFKAPLFIIQGANDPRVPASESEQMVQSIRENDGKVWYMLAKDEGHGFRKKENRDKMDAAIVLFLQENLLGNQ